MKGVLITTYYSLASVVNGGGLCFKNQHLSFGDTHISLDSTIERWNVDASQFRMHTYLAESYGLIGRKQNMSTMTLRNASTPETSITKTFPGVTVRRDQTKRTDTQKHEPCG